MEVTRRFLPVVALALGLVLAPAGALPSLMAPLSPAGPSYSHIHATMGVDLALLAAEFPTLTELTIAGETEEGREIWMLELTNFRDLDGDEPFLYVDGTVHGNEEIGGEVAYWAARKLLNGFGTDERATRLLEDARLLVLPIVNADGNMDATRKNANGVDLNRNFPWHWCESPGASPNPWSQTYCGTGPGSEAETQVIMRVIDEHRPEVAISMHSGTEKLLYPWGYTTRPSPDGDMFARLGQKFEAHVGMPASHALYPVTGASRDWVYGNHGVAAFTFEVDHHQAYSYLERHPESPETRVADAIEGTLWLLDNARRMGAHLAEPAVTAGAEGWSIDLMNDGWGDTTAHVSVLVDDAPVEGFDATTPLPAESETGVPWAPVPTGDGEGTITVRVDYDRTKLHPRPTSTEARFRVTVEDGTVTAIAPLDG